MDWLPAKLRPTRASRRDRHWRGAGHGLPHPDTQTEDDGVSEEAPTRLTKMIDAAGAHASGDLDASARDELAAYLRLRVWRLVGASPELIARGAVIQQRPREFRWACELVGNILREQRIDQITQGLVALLEEAILTYRAKRVKRPRS